VLRSSSVILWSQWSIIELNLHMTLDGLVFGLSSDHLALLHILTCMGLLENFGESKLIFVLWVTKAPPH
jgi:hypothetical protein